MIEIPTAIKLVFFDIDGTLLSTDGKYSEKTKEAIQRLHEHGIKTAIASGRPYFAAKYIVEELGIKDVGLFCTGANIYSPRTNTSLHTVVITRELANQFMSRVRSTSLHSELYSDTLYFVERNTLPVMQNTHAYHMRCEPQKADFDELIQTQPVVKFLLGATDQEGRRDILALEKSFPELEFAYASLASEPEWTFASVISRSANKADAFKQLIDIHSVKAENVMAIGDAHSDMEFIQQAGFGVAMGNASADVKNIANFITKPVWEDGVAYAINSVINAINNTYRSKFEAKI